MSTQNSPTFDRNVPLTCFITSFLSSVCVVIVLLVFQMSLVTMHNLSDKLVKLTWFC